MADGIIGQLALQVRGDMSRFKQDVQKEADKTGQTFGETFSQRFREKMTAKNIGTAIGATIGTLGIGALRIGDLYDQAADTISATTGAIGADLEALEGDFRAVAGRVKEDITVSARVLAELHQGLGTVGEPLQRLTQQWIEFGRVTGVDAAENVDLVVRAFGAFGVASDKQEASLDQLMRAQQTTGLDADRLLNLLVSYGPVLRSLGYDFAEGAALMGKWEREGVNMERSMAALRKGYAVLVAEGVPANEMQAEFARRIEEIRTSANPAQKALELFGAKGVSDVTAAIMEGRFVIDDYVDTIENGTATVESQAAAIEDAGDMFLRFKNVVATAVGPIMDDFAGVADAMGNLIFLLPALGGVVGRGLGALWTKAGGSAAVKAAAAAAGTIGGLAYQGAAFVASKFAAAGAAVWTALGGPAVMGKVTQMGTLAGGRFGMAFKVAAIAAVALLWVEVVNQFNDLMAKINEAQSRLSQQTNEALDQGGAEAIENLRKLTTTMKEIQGTDRILADTFAGEQQAVSLRNLAAAIASDASLSAEQVEDGIELMTAAAAEALARGNTEVAGEIDGYIKMLREKGPGIAESAKELVEGDLLYIEPPEIADPIKEEFDDAAKAVKSGFGAIKDALANPPQLISKADRLENMEGRMAKVMKRLRQAVRAGDPANIGYWTQAAIKQQQQMDRMRGNTVSSVADIRSAFNTAGVKVKGTWLGMQKGAKTTADEVDEVGDSLDGLPDTTKPNVDVSVTGEQQVSQLQSDLNALDGTYTASVRISGSGVRPMQHGGPVQAGVPYIVGEKRPELFVPHVSGRIEPDISRVAGGVTVNLQTYGLPMRAQTPVEVVQQVRRAARMGYLDRARKASWSRT